MSSCTVINAHINDQVLQLSNLPRIASGSKEALQFRCTFCGKWEGCGKVAVFYRDESQVYHVPVVNNLVTVPWEVLADEGFFWMGFMGQDDLTRTTEVIRVEVAKGALTVATATPQEPTPDIYQQIVASLARVDEMIAMRSAGGAMEYAYSSSAGDVYGTIKSNGTSAHFEVRAKDLLFSSGAQSTKTILVDIPEGLMPSGCVVVEAQGTGLEDFHVRVDPVGTSQVRVSIQYLGEDGATLFTSDAFCGHYSLASVSIAELADARVDAFGQTHACAGANIRAAQNLANAAGNLAAQTREQVNNDLVPRLQALENSGGEGGAGGQVVVQAAPQKPTVQMYGAAGDGATDDTAAFQMALANNRVVYVPGGTYLLSGPLTVRENCELELAQDAVLQFDQTEGNAITLLRLATLRGNHATIFVPYTFAGNVVNADTGDDQAALGDLTGDALANANSAAVPPFRKWCPMWKMSRYVTDINICKRTADGFHQSSDGTCYGTAVNLHCDAADLTSYMWGVNMGGIRIAGGFKYGIHAHNTGDHMDSWNHDMRLEAVIDACEIGVLIDNCYYSRFAVTIQSRVARDGTKYAQHGIKIVNSQGIDLSSSRVWDWDADRTLWTDGGEYQHIALVGNCQGLILDDYLCHKVSDIRSYIYTDRVANFDTMTILQEPGNKWFRSKDGEPYFYDGVGETKLLTKAELDAYFAVDTVKSFEDALASATDTDGTVYNDIGYKRGVRFNSLGEGVTIKESDMYMLTGFIPCAPGQTIYGVDLNFNSANASAYGYAGIVFYNGSKTWVKNMAIGKLITGDQYTIVTGSYTETSDGFSVQVSDYKGMTDLDIQYVRLVFPITGVGNAPMISIDDPIKYTAEGFLSDGVKVKGDSVVLTSAGGKAYTLTVSDNGALTAVAIE